MSMHINFVAVVASVATLLSCAGCDLETDETATAVGARLGGSNTPFFVYRRDGEIEIRWKEIENAESYNVYLTDENRPEARWLKIADVTSPYTYPAPDLSHPYYVYVSAVKNGVEKLITGRGTVVAFTRRSVAPYGPLVVADYNNDGCQELAGALNDCSGNLFPFSEEEAGLGALRANKRVWRDLRFADFTGDGVVDAIANTYTDLADENSMMLSFIGQGGGRFEEDERLRELDLRGFGETLVVADFNNDGRLDALSPAYSDQDPRQQNFLLLGLGDGTFREVADDAGVAARGDRRHPEGAQALDLDGDGHLDFFTGGKFYRNDGDGLIATLLRFGGDVPTFTDIRKDLNLPRGFDEGAKFLDWNNDGLLDFLHHNPDEGPRLFENQGDVFREVEVFPKRVYQKAFGANVYDVNGDGREDVILGGGEDGNGRYLNNTLWLNDGERFVENAWIDEYVQALNNIVAFADFDADGTVEPIVRRGDIYHFDPQHRHRDVIIVEMLSHDGKRNQFGRSVVLEALNEQGKKHHRVVDGGSGYLSQNLYEILIPTGSEGSYRVSARYPSGEISTVVKTGQRVRIFEGGKIEFEDLALEGPSPPIPVD